jgi:hypothetical protein
MSASTIRSVIGAPGLPSVLGSIPFALMLSHRLEALIHEKSEAAGLAVIVEHVNPGWLRAVCLQAPVEPRSTAERTGVARGSNGHRA